jgi:hypothetical protein
MKVIVINAAPRMEAGNTQMILKPFVEGLRSETAHVEVTLLARKKIKRCLGCFTCYAKTPGRCVHVDDMRELTERIRVADLLLLATPVYIDGMTALAKTFLDRLVVFLDPHFEMDGGKVIHPLRWKFPEQLCLLSVCGYPGLHNFDPLLLHMERLARNFHTQFVGAILRPAVFSMLLSRKYPDRVQTVMDSIRLAGKEVARGGEISAETIKSVAADICPPEELVETANAYWDRELSRRTEQPA